VNTSPRILRAPRITLAIASAALLVAAGFVFAGPLHPPAGPVTSTYKTLTEVEPRIAINAANTPGDADSLFKITQRGSYYLTGNITGVIGKHGIEIVASGVTLDLMGFDLSGIPAMGAFDGVSLGVGNLANITIRNGSVRAWGGDGIDVNFSDNNLLDGLRVQGNGGSGIIAGTTSTVTGCTAFANTGNGISAGFGSTVTGCTAQSNIGDGIFAGSGSTVTGCTASFNSGDGISAGSGSTVTGCTASTNFGDGIQVNFDCRVTDNTCDSNGFSTGDGAGIHATGTDNRIEGNNCTDADRGIDVDVAGNIIIRNTCSGNTSNWEIAVGNVCLVILATPTVAAISGDSGGLSPGSTNPNANFTY